MKSRKNVSRLVLALSILFTALFNSQAQIYNTKRTVTFYAPNGIQVASKSLNVSSNEIITIQSLNIAGTPGTSGSYSPGNFILNFADGGVYLAALLPLTNNSIQFTGVTNISFNQPVNNGNYLGYLVTLEIKSPVAQTSIPANSVVIPSDTAGPVNIILESSSDLVNWIPSNPGIYGASSTNRFFRVRATMAN